jgi:hypothetical protein
MSKFKVKIYAAPIIYEIEAKNKTEAELGVCKNEGFNDWSEIYKIRTEKIK